MTERDEDLNEILKRWDAPAPGPGLDARVWDSYRRTKQAPSRKWLPVAAGIVLVGGFARLMLPGPAATVTRADIHITTTMNGAGFQPVDDGAISVVKGNKP